MPMAIYLGGDAQMVNFTPAANVAAGDVVIVNDTARIAHRDIPSGVLGALGAGVGIYRVAGDGVIAADKKVYWNAAASQVTLTVGSNKVFGVTVTACTGAAALCDVLHNPGL